MIIFNFNFFPAIFTSNAKPNFNTWHDFLNHVTFSCFKCHYLNNHGNVSMISVTFLCWLAGQKVAPPRGIHFVRPFDWGEALLLLLVFTLTFFLLFLLCFPSEICLSGNHTCPLIFLRRLLRAFFLSSFFTPSCYSAAFGALWNLLLWVFKCPSFLTATFLKRSQVECALKGRAQKHTDTQIKSVLHSNEEWSENNKNIKS